MMKRDQEDKWAFSFETKKQSIYGTQDKAESFEFAILNRKF